GELEVAKGEEIFKNPGQFGELKTRPGDLDGTGLRPSGDGGERWMIGAAIDPDEGGNLMVRRVLEGSPADKAG
ncbi:MAG: hypothetical protein OSA48_11885, partial [Akkermansiaceae bacterium]|nr:hypothetical protein [Akkermansiaceae bacterium]